MPKIKTKSGAAKRFKVTGTGKVKYKKSGLMHKLGCKAEGRKRNLKQRGVLGPSDAPRIPSQLPYGF
jgi:large subunit ribosomal protein L35